MLAEFPTLRTSGHWGRYSMLTVFASCLVCRLGLCRDYWCDLCFNLSFYSSTNAMFDFNHCGTFELTSVSGHCRSRRTLPQKRQREGSRAQDRRGKARHPFAIKPHAKPGCIKWCKVSMAAVICSVTFLPYVPYVLYYLCAVCTVSYVLCRVRFEDTSLNLIYENSNQNVSYP